MNYIQERDRHQNDPKRRARLRWRTRRGLLENDLILSRFLSRHEATLTDEEVAALDQLLDLTDNDLLDLLLSRTDLNDYSLTLPGVKELLTRLQQF